MLTLESTTQTQQLKCCYVDTLKDMSDTVRLKWKQRIRNTAQFPQWWFSSGFTARGCALMFLQRLIESTTSESIELQKFKESFLQQCFVCVKWRRDSGGWNIIQILHRFFFSLFFNQPECLNGAAGRALLQTHFSTLQKHVSWPFQQKPFIYFPNALDLVS